MNGRTAKALRRSAKAHAMAPDRIPYVREPRTGVITCMPGTARSFYKALKKHATAEHKASLRLQNQYKF